MLTNQSGNSRLVNLRMTNVSSIALVLCLCGCLPAGMRTASDKQMQHRFSVSGISSNCSESQRRVREYASRNYSSPHPIIELDDTTSHILFANGTWKNVIRLNSVLSNPVIYFKVSFMFYGDSMTANFNFFSGLNRVNEECPLPDFVSIHEAVSALSAEEVKNIKLHLNESR